MVGMDTTRVDKWLWAVRMTKTRSQATDACSAGHVKINGAPAKAAHPVRVGDRVEAFLHGRQRLLEVVRIIEKRVSAPIAAECLVDHSPPPPPKEEWFPNFARDAGAGRPTKKDRRKLDRFRYPQ
jgi:ribosome-associated heat shock protein Hsp15